MKPTALSRDPAGQSTVALASLAPFLRMAEQSSPELVARGRAETDRLLQRWGLAATQLEADPTQRLPYGLVLELHELFIALFDDPSAPLRAGWLLEPGDYLLLEYLCSSCATLRDCVRCMGEYYPLLIDAQYELVEANDLAEVRFRLAPDLEAPPAMLEFAQASNFRMASLHIEPSHLQLPVEVRFRHSAPAHAAQFESVFFCPIRFDCEHDSTVFKASLLDAPMARPDATLHMLLKQFADQQMAALPRMSAFPRKVRQAIAAELRDGAPLEAVAQALGTTSSALRTRLSQHGLTYKTLLEEVRREHAKTLLRDPELNISEVAYRLGFSHPPALHRAFKRWFGVAPTEYRASVQRHPASRFWRSS